ncbi:MAG: Transcription elongation factor GreA [Candidatus Curtissbacteria bacterium GW2011_GWA1_40_47]|nr:MAG: Transcription elongation factor GreA [Candidatus Curtissbacteria bacterium GW2011_GWB1_40_28]KKR60921.1 MAG: Transcription elongation factor GreA [Candidatus Curtissbacteria bacterium GW2011_GWA2_40_31]KKR61446.1 MAG: Transcription elongation factor GreA [Microgenomates group bacterium GW2011_GWC1_40_35]KKR65235.1 MAG: Transcription elongation factor GreA [Candidatus Curtissbacteria bacterium GW2011_GWA1_40_47]KKR76492.1 MAG: Transcription elongation factor GreA [Candidatus Curtissbacte
MNMTQSSKKFILTPQGLAKLEGEYDLLVNVKRSQIIQRIERAREFGDLSENSEYDAAKEEQSLLEHRISELEEVLHKAQIISETPKNGFVVIGSTVVVEMGDEVHEFTIVGSMEADPATKKISNESPVGQALLGLRVGETIEVAVGPVKSKIRVLEIK